MIPVHCVYDAPSPEVIRKVAERNGLPVDRVTEATLFGLVSVSGYFVDTPATGGS